ncbi:NAD(P)H-dependent oxidoreductase [Nocardioides lentus]|uniref:NAD(P)H-dependent oxidoreductase n=1 Tax=Nocardioides lentus TaxID=338077 RepID=A0ABP5AR75_9ACTN
MSGPAAGPAAGPDGRATTALVVGNPKPASRTLVAGRHVVTGLTDAEPDLVVDLGLLGARLLDRGDGEVTALVDAVAGADLVVVASPTYKATYTGLLKVFLDRFAAGAIRGVSAPVMLAGSPHHALAAELTLRPVLSEIASGPVLKGLCVLEAEHDDPRAYADWLGTARPTTDRLLAPTPAPTGAPA